MKLTIFKRVMILGLMTVILLGKNDVEVMAETIPDEVIETTVTKNKSSSFSAGGATIKAKASIFYWYGDQYYASESGWSYASVGGASASISKKKKGADVVAGIGYHYVGWNSHTWRPTLKIGTVITPYVWL